MENQDTSRQTEMPEISFAEILAFFRKNAKKLLLFAVCSLVVAFLLIIIVYCFAPREQGYQSSIVLTLTSDQGHYCYPSGKRFSNADLLSRPVLRKVYQNLDLEKTVSFEDFSGSFYISQTSMRKAFLDAQFKAKMNVRNINVVQLAQLEREYQEAIASIRTGVVTIAMKPRFPVNSHLAARILTAIPEAWFEIYSVQEAGRYPAPVPVQQIQNLAQGIGQDGQLILLEKCLLYCRQLHVMCSTLNEMLQGRFIVLPSGETLGDLQNRLNLVQRYQINMLSMYVLEHPEYYGTFDKVFLESRAKNVEYELLRVKGRYDGALAAMNVLMADGRGSGVQGKDMKGAAGTLPAGAPVTFQFDAGFFSAIEQLIRNDINSELRRTLANKMMVYRDEWATLDADLTRYREILDIVNGKKTPAVSVSVGKEKFYSMMREMIGELFVVSGKIKTYRELVLRETNTSRQFCTRDADVRTYSVPMYPLSRIAIGLITVWALVNLGLIFFLFYTRKKA